MGIAIDRDSFRPEEFSRFSGRLIECLEILKQMLADPEFGGRERSWGAELELYLVDDSGKVAHCNEEIIAAARCRGADVLATACPLCQFNLDSAQRKSLHGAHDGIGGVSVVYFTQLIALALGLDQAAPERAGVDSAASRVPEIHQLKARAAQLGIEAGDYQCGERRLKYD